MSTPPYLSIEALLDLIDEPNRSACHRLIEDNRALFQSAGGNNRPAGNQRRMMGPLAAFCHMCDVASARLWFDHPMAEGDPGASRCQP
ncbi:MAG: hypothetical protein KC731_32030 [Myxococcales bacterium]|nr:hypothetical protein [Myxococcales bacterium]